MRFGSANQAVDLNRKSISLFIVAFKVHLTVHDCTSHKYAVDFHGYHCSTGQKFDIFKFCFLSLVSNYPWCMKK